MVIQSQIHQTLPCLNKNVSLYSWILIFQKGKATEMEVKWNVEVKWKAFHVLLANGQFFTSLYLSSNVLLGTVVEHKLQWNANTDISFLLKKYTLIIGTRIRK